jgi:hypothetical protein
VKSSLDLAVESFSEKGYDITPFTVHVRRAPPTSPTIADISPS